MDNDEAIALLEREIAHLRGEAYADLVRRIVAGPINYVRRGPSGTDYQIEVQVLWDGRPGGNVMVLGSIDDSGWRAFLPLNRDFIMAPDGSFVGE